MDTPESQLTPPTATRRSEVARASAPRRDAHASSAVWRWRPCTWALALGAVLACAPGTTESPEPTPVSTYTPPAFEGVGRNLTQADIEGLMESLSNWGRWGADDELGAANLITPEKRRAALALATRGEVVSLAHPLLTATEIDVPAPFEREIIRLPDLAAEPPLRGGVSDTYRVSYHGYSHSHIDSLCHILYRGQMYNGRSRESVTEAGCSFASIAALRGGIVTRGVLIDIPHLRGEGSLEPGTPIFVEDLEAFEEMAGLHVQPGDAVFIRTGRWARRAAQGPWDVSQGSAGLHASTVPWFKARDVAFLGSDAALDVIPSGVEGVDLPVHLMVIVALGVDIFDNQDLEALSQKAAELGQWEFLLTAGPLVVPTGTGSPINALAVF